MEQSCLDGEIEVMVSVSFQGISKLTSIILNTGLKAVMKSQKEQDQFNCTVYSVALSTQTPTPLLH